MKISFIFNILLVLLVVWSGEGRGHSVQKLRQITSENRVLTFTVSSFGDIVVAPHPDYAVLLMLTCRNATFFHCHSCPEAEESFRSLIESYDVMYAENPDGLPIFFGEADFSQMIGEKIAAFLSLTSLPAFYFAKQSTAELAPKPEEVYYGAAHITPQNLADLVQSHSNIKIPIYNPVWRRFKYQLIVGGAYLVLLCIPITRRWLLSKWFFFSLSMGLFYFILSGSIFNYVIEPEYVFVGDDGKVVYPAIHWDTTSQYVVEGRMIAAFFGMLSLLWVLVAHLYLVKNAWLQRLACVLLLFIFVVVANHLLVAFHVKYPANNYPLPFIYTPGGWLSIWYD